MPYVAIKCLPKDEETKKKTAEAINQVLLDVWGAEQQYIGISIEEASPEEMGEVFAANMDKMLMVAGELKQ